MRTPFLTTRFSEEGKRAKKRFGNIISDRKKHYSGIVVLFSVLFMGICGMLIGCNSTSVGVIGGEDAAPQVLLKMNGNYTKSMHDNISKAILDHNKDRFVFGDCYAEGHIILESEEIQNGYKVYTISTYGTFNFCGDHFEHGSGCGNIPTVLTFDNEHNLIDYQIPLDGAYYTESIKEMFPEHLHEFVLNIPATESENLRAQKMAYAEEYLKSVGKEGMSIGYYGDFH